MEKEWGYCQKNGPSTWVNCFPTAAGSRQSPVDIQSDNTKVTDTTNRLTWKYVPENIIDICNTGYGWKVHVNSEGSELLGGPLEDRYVLEQFHCHWGETNDKGSEHTVNGKYFAGELHLVHWNATKYSSFADAAQQPDGLAVLGVFLQPGKKDTEIEKVVSYLSDIEYKNQSVSIKEPIDPNNMLPKYSDYYTYLGSLTTPPCSECVIWILFKEPLEISISQLEAFRKLKSYCCEESCPSDEFEGFVKNNLRPTLPLGEREIKECRQ